MSNMKWRRIFLTLAVVASVSVQLSSAATIRFEPKDDSSTEPNLIVQDLEQEPTKGSRPHSHVHHHGHSHDDHDHDHDHDHSHEHDEHDHDHDHEDERLKEMEKEDLKKELEADVDKNLEELDRLESGSTDTPKILDTGKEVNDKTVPESGSGEQVRKKRWWYYNDNDWHSYHHTTEYHPGYCHYGHCHRGHYHIYHHRR